MPGTLVVNNRREGYEEEQGHGVEGIVDGSTMGSTAQSRFETLQRAQVSTSWNPTGHTVWTRVTVGPS